MDQLIVSAVSPVSWRGVERVGIVLGAILAVYCGYRLYIRGMSKGRTAVEVQSAFLRFILSGTGPGIIFMAFGATVLVAGLMTGGVTVSSTEEQIPGAAQNAAERLRKELRTEIADLKSQLESLPKPSEDQPTVDEQVNQIQETVGKRISELESRINEIPSEEAVRSIEKRFKELSVIEQRLQELEILERDMHDRESEIREMIRRQVKIEIRSHGGDRDRLSQVLSELKAVLMELEHELIQLNEH